IFVSNSSAVNQTVIEKNLFKDNTNSGAASGHGIYADQFTAGVGIQNILIQDNKFANTSLVVDSWGVGLSNTDTTPFSNITITNNDISNFGRGMYFFNTTLSSATGNTITGASNYGIGV